MRLAALLVSALVVAGCGGNSHRQSYTFGADNGLPAPTTFGPRPRAPRAREIAALRVARADPTLSRLLPGAASFSRSDVWGGVDGKPLGVQLFFALPHAVSVDADLPYVTIPPDAPAHGQCVVPYAAGWNHLAADDVTVVNVLVDLRRDRVAEIETNAARGTISPVPGKPYPSCDEDSPG